MKDKQAHKNSNGTVSHESVDEKDRIKQYGTEIEGKLKDYTYEQRVKWITDMKEQANVLFKQQKHEDAVDTYMQALCGFNFNQKGYPKMTKEKKKEIDFDLKMPILNNMSLSFYQRGFACMDEQPKNALNLFTRSSDLIDQVLKIDPRNEKALIRKCSILIEQGNTKQYEKLIKTLEDVAFQSERSQVLYTNLKKMQERIDESPKPLSQRKPQPKKQQEVPQPQTPSAAAAPTANATTDQKGGKNNMNNFNKEKDWYYQQKQEKQR